MTTPRPQTFIYNPQRDAFKAIRGFYYQVQLTVVRWLELTGETVLICECGEDIDHVFQLRDRDAETQRRLLEQIKLRGRITLRSSEALSAQARFRDAVVKNPGIQLLYRFSTTATVGQEQRLRFPRGLKGIEAWEVMRRGEFTQEETTAFVDALKALVADSQCPRELDQPAFSQLQEYFGQAGSQVVEDLVRRFEWATGLPDPPDLLSGIRDLLIEQGRAHAPEEAAHLADVLIVHVFRLLTARDEKRLTVEGIENLLRERSLTEVDRRVLTALTRQVEQAGAHIATLSSQMEVMSQQVAVFQSVPLQLDQLLARVSDVQAQLAQPTLPPPDEPPIVDIVSSRRRGLVQKLTEALRATVWLSIEGATGMGKTYAAKLLVDEQVLTGNVWISLRGERPAHGTHRIDVHLLRLAADPTVRRHFAGDLRFSELVAHAARNLGLIVIDELPDLLKEPLLSEQLLILCSVLGESGGKVITTSTRGIPQRLAGGLGGRLQQITVPPMEVNEIAEMLAEAGAPTTFRESTYVDFILGITRGHPSLVSAVIAFLRRSAWAVGEEQLTALISGDIAREVKTETVRRVASLVANGEARELLYRLSLVGRNFNRDTAFVIASVPPPISQPGEHLNELVGPWVNRLPNDRMEVSPLLSQAWQETLSPERRQKIHRAIARHYLRQREIDQHEASQIIVHSLAGEDWRLLVGFLLRLAIQLRTRTEAAAFDFVTLLFTSGWPDGMAVSFRIMFRAIQVRLLMLLNRDETSFAEDLERLTSQSEQEALPAVLTAFLLVGPMNPAARPGLLARRVLQARRVLGRLPQDLAGLSGDVPFESMIWLGVTKMRQLNDVREVLGVLKEMTPEERAASLSYSPSVDATQLFVDQCWMLELRKEEDKRDWEAVLKALDGVRGVAEMPGCGSLLAPAARARAIVLADHLGRHEEALDVIEQRWEDVDANGRFLLEYTAGCIMLDNSTPQQALERFRRALALGATAHAFLRFDAARFATEAAGRSGNWVEAIELVKTFLRISKSEKLDSILAYERFEMIGELAWAWWKVGNARRACAAMSAVVRSLARTPKFEEPRFREVFQKTGHVLGWMVSVEKHREPPSHTIDGSRYTEPFPGIFLRSRPAIGTAPVRMLTHVLWVQLGWLAMSAGLIGLARKSLLAGRAAAESAGFRAFCCVVDLDLGKVAVRSGDYAEALRRGILGIRSLAISRSGEGRADFISSTFPLDEVWASLSQQQRREAEAVLFWAIVGPAITRTLAYAGAGEIGSLTESFERLFSESAEELSDINYWLDLLREVRIAFSPLAIQETIRGQIDRHSGDLEKVVLLYLALGEAPNATLADSCGAQAVAFEVLLRTLPASDPMTHDIARYLISFWRRMAETQPFALRRPHVFRVRMMSAREVSLGHAAQILLWAAEATGTTLGPELNRKLAQAVEREQLSPIDTP